MIESVKDLRVYTDCERKMLCFSLAQVQDIVELFNLRNFVYVLSDEFAIYEEGDQFVPDEDSKAFSFDCISRVWREDEHGNYMLIFSDSCGGR